ANRYIIAKGAERQLVLYWYWAHDRAVASEYLAKFYLVADSIRMNRSDGSLVRVTTPLRSEESADAALDRLLAFAGKVVPVLNSSKRAFFRQWAHSSGRFVMTRSLYFRLFLILALMGIVFSGCSRDPNVRKQKYFESGQRYFERGKYREAAIQYSNAVQVDPRFTDAHYRLAQTYLKLQEWTRAYQELSRTIELQPDNYQAHIDIANLL